MLKERYEKTKNFVKDHKTEILLGTITVAGAILIGYKFKKQSETINEVNKKAIGAGLHNDYFENGIIRNDNKYMNLRLELDTLYDLGYRSMSREESRIRFEIDELKAYINNLDHTKNINIFYRIPEKEARIRELEEQLQDVLLDKNTAKDVMSVVWGERD